MATKLYDLAVARLKYKTPDGKDKTVWDNICSVLQDQDQQGNKYSFIMLKKSFCPAGIPSKEGSDSIRVSLFKPKDKNSRSNNAQGYQPQQQSYNSYDNSPQFESVDVDSECPF